MRDISKYHVRPSYASTFVANEIIKHEGTPEAIKVFAAHAEKLDDYSYWFMLSTCWVSYTGWSDLELWKKLFNSNRPKRKHSIMKPSEVRAYDFLPNVVTIYRAHRHDEQDWIAYTLDKTIAARFALERSVTSFKKYQVDKKHIFALFTRRGEQEVIILDKRNVRFVEELQLALPGMTLRRDEEFPFFMMSFEEDIDDE